MLTDEERKEHEREYARRWCREHPEKCYAYSAKYAKSHLEKGRKKQARYAAVHLEKVHALYAKWRKANPEKVVRARKLYYEANRQKAIENASTWAKEHPEENRLRCAKRHALKYSNTPTDELLTLAQWHDVLTQYNGHCAYCDREAKLTLDHVIPLSKGGTHSKNNVVPACGHCNSSKGNKTVEEWNAKRLTQASN